MNVTQLQTIMDAARCSPEELGSLMGVSGMTFRRWAKDASKSDIPKLYIPALRDACYQLISSKRLSAELPEVQELLSQTNLHQYEAAIQELGLPGGFDLGSSPEVEILQNLEKIGAQESKQLAVIEGRDKLLSYKKFGEEWNSRVNNLLDLVRSKKISGADKYVAYGALFYLLTPIDFIPDYIPFVGLLDDFGVLGIAASFYAKKFLDRS